jgi:RHS repeat-associated protein
LSITDINGDGKKDILLGSYTSGTSAAQIAYLADAAGLPIKFFEVTPSTSRPLFSVTNVGSTAGQFRVDESGAATYSIPLGLPEGVAGVTPEVALNYSSQAGNGLVGKGWSLSGSSAISRCRQTLSQDNGAKPITFTSSDRFCLNGQRLILVSGASYGAVGSIYKTEIDTFVTVTANGGSAGHPASFTVTAKDGSTSTYGGTTDSRVSAPVANTILSWAISRFEDNVKNRIEYVYEGDATTGQRLSVINYAFTSPNSSTNPASKIEFDYGVADRPDPTSSFVAGYEFKQIKRLNKIKISNNGTELRTFNLSYMATLSTDSRYKNNISRLEHVQECKSNSCFPPLTFNWGGGSHISFNTDSPQEINFSDTTAGKTVMNQLFADITGDGKSDLIYLLYDSGMAWVYVKRADSATQARVTGFTNYNDIRISNLDYNADGRQDLAIYDGVKWKVYLSTVRADAKWSIDSTSVAIDVGLNNKDTAFVDINSDGLADAVTADSYRLLVRNGQPNTSNQAYSFGTNSTTAPKTAGSITWDSAANFPELLTMPPVGTCIQESYKTKILLDKVADFNGDGVVDFIGTYSQRLSCTQIPGVGNTVYMEREYSYALAYRDGVMTNYGGAAIKASTTSTADLNGDGLTDLIFSDSSKYSYRLNNGNGFNGLVEWISLRNYTENPIKPQFFDFNGDGSTDIVWNDRDTSQLKVRLWGSDLITVIRASGGAATDAHFLMDTTGDGVLDYIKITSTALTAYSGVMAVTGAAVPCHNVYSIPAYPGYACVGAIPDPSIPVPKGEQHNAIVSIENGLGNITKISYGSLANPDANNIKHYLTTDVNPTTTTETRVNTCYPYCPATVTYSTTTANEFYARLNGGWDLPAGSNTLIADNTSKGAPVLEVNGSMQIVTSVESSAPTAGAIPKAVALSAMSKVSYFYYEAKMQASGRGFLGFNRLKTVDAQSGVATVTTYRQDFPFMGSPLSTVVFSSDTPTAKVLSRADNTWSFKSFTGTDNTKGYQPQLSASTEMSYDAFSSQLLQTSTTTSLIDDYGNPTKITKVTTGKKSDGTTNTSITQETTNIYGSGDEYYQRMGRLTNSSVKTTRDSEPSKTRASAFTYYGDGDTNGAKGLLKTETVEPNNTAGMTTEYQYDKFGNKSKTLTTAINSRGVSETRTTTVLYSQSNGRDLLSTTNDLNQQAAFTARNEYGQVTDGTDINSIGSHVFYDELGREYMRKDDTGAWTRTESAFCTSGCPTGAVYFTKKRAAGGSSATEYYDILGRAIRSSKVSFDGRIVNVDTEYDNVSRVKRQSLPFFDGDTSISWTTNNYDFLGRLTSVAVPDGSTEGAVTRNEVSNYSTTITNPLNQTRTETRNGLGQLVKVTDFDGNTIEYDYDILGGLLNATTKTKPSALPAESLSVLVRMCYDDFGRKTAMLDPDKGGFKAAAGDATLACSSVTAGRAGWWTYQYDGFGELISQRDPKGQIINMVYDKLGRMIGRTDILAGSAIEGFTQWFYEKGVDGSQASVQGKLTAVVMNTDPALTPAQVTNALNTGLASCTQNSVSCHKTLNNFDIFARPLDATVYYPGSSQAFISRVSYDLFGRANRQFDALDLVIGNTASGVQISYNDYGYAISTSDIGSGELLQETLSTNANGQTLSEKRGNGVTSTNVYDNFTGQLTDQQSGIGTLFSVQNIHYKWDTIGNLKYRDNQTPFKSGGGGTKNLKESFCYDNLNRLTKTVSGIASLTPTCTGAQDITYNGLGNIMSKSGVSYGYGVNAGPHAVTSAGGNTYTYDNNGNQIAGDGRNLTYTSYDMVKCITKAGDCTSNNATDNRTLFSYGPDRARWKREDKKAGVKTTTLYLGNVERITTDNSTDIEWKRSVGGVIYTYKTNASNQLQATNKAYVYNDHLGSIDVITNGSGVIQQSLSFNPWGARRNGETWGTFSPNELSISTVFTQPVTKRGFTGHEMVDDMGLIHMNGRIYDQKLARFLQADPFIQAAVNTQSYNRYSYLWNNPLNATDPSGLFNIFKKFGLGGGSWLAGTGDFIGAAAINYTDSRIAANPMASQIYVTAVTAVSAYFCGACSIGFSAMASANMAYYQTGSFSTAFRAGAIAGISSAVFYGVGEVFQGTGFFAQGGAGHIFTHAMVGGIMAELQGGKFGSGFASAGISAALSPSVGKISNYGGRIVVSAVIGGTASVITGGKFANGAMTAAFAHILNFELHTQFAAVKTMGNQFLAQQATNEGEAAGQITLGNNVAAAASGAAADMVGAAAICTYEHASCTASFSFPFGADVGDFNGAKLDATYSAEGWKFTPSLAVVSSKPGLALTWDYSRSISHETYNGFGSGLFFKGTYSQPVWGLLGFKTSASYGMSQVDFKIGGGLILGGSSMSFRPSVGAGSL